MIVPIPVMEPTLDAGLVLVSGYFYPQTDAQKNAQPASVTAAAGLYTRSESFSYGIAQQSYWKEDKWRFTGVLAHADLKLSLVTSSGMGDRRTTDWLLKGNYLMSQLSRKLSGSWYLGGVIRYVDIQQRFEILPGSGFDTRIETSSVALGLNLERDSSDMPFNPYSGNIFRVKALFSDPVWGSDRNYQSYSLSFRSYHQWQSPLVLAWEVKGCHRAGLVPLWDACQVGLRGFPVTDYLGKTTASGQAEVRWRMTRRWGLVTFLGAGKLDSSATDFDDQEVIPSYGAGLRFMVLEAKRINMRLDYARSTDSDAVYVAVGEAF